MRGGGAKPFRQKGTGRARQGSSRSPSMIGGGVALGPKPRSYAQRTPKKMVRLALLSALSDRAEIGRITVIDDWKIEAPKTKDAATVVRKLRLNGTVLVVLAADELAVERSFANLPDVQTTTFGELSAHDVIRADWLVFSDRTLPSAPATSRAPTWSRRHPSRGARPRSAGSRPRRRRPPRRRRRPRPPEGRRPRRPTPRAGARGGRRRDEDVERPSAEDRRARRNEEAGTDA